MAEETTYPVCRQHLSQAHGCRAKALQRRLKREGYRGFQYQGAVQTNAPADWVQEYLDQIEDKRTVG